MTSAEDLPEFDEGESEEPSDFQSPHYFATLPSANEAMRDILNGWCMADLSVMSRGAVALSCASGVRVHDDARWKACDRKYGRLRPGPISTKRRKQAVDEYEDRMWAIWAWAIAHGFIGKGEARAGGPGCITCASWWPAEEEGE